jgi:NAD(P)-dependent dehydrogenase (short-subunit alcohol dehydrogenase family)
MFFRTFGINFKAAFNLTQVFAKDIIARGGTEGGTIVNISSVVSCKM